MIPVKDMTSAADVYANIKRLQGVFYPSRRVAPAQVNMAAKQAADETYSSPETRQECEEFQPFGEGNTSPEVDAQPKRDIIDLSKVGLDAIPEVFRPKARANRIVKAIAAERGVTADDIFGTSRNYKIRDARFEAVARIYAEFPQWSLREIGNFFGGRDHTTILNALKKMKVWKRTRAW